MGKKIVLIMLIALVLGVGIGVGGTIYFYKSIPTNSKVKVARTNSTQSGMPMDKGGPLVSIGEFTLNLQGGSFLKTQITVEGTDAKSEDFLKSKSAFIKDAVNAVLSDKSLADIQTSVAREKLRQELLFKLNIVADDNVANVLFESFVYQ